MRALACAGLFAAVMYWSSCSRSNNLLMGRVEAGVGGHKVVVTDCYRTSVPPPVQYQEAGATTYRFTPCRDADVLIRGEELTVNGEAYGHLNPTDGVLVDHSVVKIQHELRN